MRCTAAGFLAAATLFACADFDADWTDPDDPDSDPDDPNPDPDPDPDPTPDVDYTNAFWRLTNVSSTANTISHDPQIAFVGRSPVVAFSEPDSNDFGDQSIHVSTTDGLIWTDTLIADGGGEQLAFPSLVATDGAAHLVYSGRGDDGDRDIFITGRAGGVWSEPLNMTDEAAGEVRQNQRPQVVIAGGVPTALYFSSAAAVGATAESVEIRALAMGGAPETVYTADVSICFALEAVADGDGNIHAITTCGGFVYLTNAGGSWSVVEIPLGESGTPSVADLSVDPKGGVHMAWAGRTDCPEEGEGERCTRIFYARDLGTPVVVTRETEGYHPALAADADGRPLVAYHVNTVSGSRIHISHSNDGASFVTPRSLGDGVDREWLASELVFGPDGMPHLMYERMIADSDPLDVDIIWATIVED